LTSDSNFPTTLYNTWQRFTKARHGETGIHEMKKKKKKYMMVKCTWTSVDLFKCL